MKPKIGDRWRLSGASLLVSCTIFALLVPLQGLAQGDNIDLARETFSEGQEKFDNGEYEAAKEAFLRSLEAFPHFRTIFNIALCEEKLGNIPAALEMYERYRDWPSEVPNRDEVSQKIAELGALLPPEESPAAPEESVATPEDDTAEDEARSEPAPPRGDGEQRDDSRLEVPGWILLGAGAAGAVVGGILIGVAGARSNEMRDVENTGEPFDSDTHGSLPDEGTRLETAGWVVGALGVASLATGVVLIVLSKRNPEEPAPVAIGLLPGSTGVKLAAEVRF